MIIKSYFIASWTGKVDIFLYTLKDLKHSIYTFVHGMFDSHDTTLMVDFSYHLNCYSLLELCYKQHQ